MAACAAFSFASAQETGFGFGVKAGVNISEPDAGRRSQVQSGFHRRRIRRLPHLQLVRRIGRRTLFASRQQDQGLRRQAAYGLPEHSRSRQFLPDARHGAEGRRSARLPAGGQSEGRATSKSMSRRCTRRSTCRIPVGLSYDFKFGLILDARYNIGVTNLAKDAGCTRNSVFAVTAGWRF